MLIRPANQTDIAVLLEHDNWVSKKVIAKKVDSGQVYVVFDSDTFVAVSYTHLDVYKRQEQTTVAVPRFLPENFS